MFLGHFSPDDQHLTHYPNNALPPLAPSQVIEVIAGSRRVAFASRIARRTKPPHKVVMEDKTSAQVICCCFSCQASDSKHRRGIQHLFELSRHSPLRPPEKTRPVSTRPRPDLCVRSARIASTKQPTAPTKKYKGSRYDRDVNNDRSPTTH